MLTRIALGQKANAVLAAELDRETRVRVFTMDGVQIGIPGVGENKHVLSFPRRFLVRDALNCTTWIRFATDEETSQTPSGFVPRWYRDFDCFIPKYLIHCNGKIACPDDPMGLIGQTLTAIATKASDLPFEERDCADVSSISTPPTPDPFRM